jgi:flagellar secretion chaperone FliS
MPASIHKAEEMKRRYLREAVITATPATRLTMLYDHMLHEMRVADDGFERNDLKAINDGLCKVQEVLLALRSTLRTDLWAGAADLSALYSALHAELVQANMQKDRARAQRVAKVVTDLAEAWQGAAQREASRPKATAATGGGAA